MAKQTFDFRRTFTYLQAVYGSMRAQALVNTVKDIRSKARSSMKVANRTRTLKSGAVKQVTGAHSKPGEAPYRRKGGLYNMISWSAMDTDLQKTQRLGFVVGPEVFPGRRKGTTSVPAVLERGGTSTAKTEIHRPANRRRFAPDEIRDTYVNKYGQRRSNRPNRVNQTYYKRYRYFYIRDSWEAARYSDRFLKWAHQNSESVTIEVPIVPRPYMAPAVAYETSPARWIKRVDKARDYYLRKNKPIVRGLADIDPSGRYAQGMPEFMK